ncbi:hypothetical protein KOR34_01060 [Posidoniimonas corsicana]|uniref:Uncharacterized protein n=1 Tax=Posidoniimonas corsicana TaxID=1938618 RepID=A0A5C5V9H5_9BACT|nr:hypothetical protein [Posidoniimonas corsicana]TWT35218.1 hypothetical protein KOR34_01060 [Posidoniimonas corsicana]
MDINAPSRQVYFAQTLRQQLALAAAAQPPEETCQKAVSVGYYQVFHHRCKPTAGLSECNYTLADDLGVSVSRARKWRDDRNAVELLSGPPFLKVLLRRGDCPLPPPPGDALCWASSLRRPAEVLAKTALGNASGPAGRSAKGIPLQAALMLEAVFNSAAYFEWFGRRIEELPANQLLDDADATILTAIARSANAGIDGLDREVFDPAPEHAPTAARLLLDTWTHFPTLLAIRESLGPDHAPAGFRSVREWL